eukprot:g2657.t1
MGANNDMSSKIDANAEHKSSDNVDRKASTKECAIKSNCDYKVTLVAYNNGTDLTKGTSKRVTYYWVQVNELEQTRGTTDVQRIVQTWYVVRRFCEFNVLRQSKGLRPRSGMFSLFNARSEDDFPSILKGSAIDLFSEKSSKEFVDIRHIELQRWINSNEDKINESAKKGGIAASFLTQHHHTSLNVDDDQHIWIHPRLKEKSRQISVRFQSNLGKRHEELVKTHEALRIKYDELRDKNQKLSESKAALVQRLRDSPYHAIFDRIDGLSNDIARMLSCFGESKRTPLDNFSRPKKTLEALSPPVPHRPITNGDSAEDRALERRRREIAKSWGRATRIFHAQRRMSEEKETGGFMARRKELTEEWLRAKQIFDVMLRDARDNTGERKHD